MMGEYRALDAAKAYGVKCGIVLQTLLTTGSQPGRWRLFSFRWYNFTAHAGNGIVVSGVAWPSYCVRRFEFYPVDGKSFMLPLWVAYPAFNSVTIGWRMGTGEAYKCRWHDWYRRLSEEKKVEYRKQFPPPGEGAWQGFYEEIAAHPSQGTIADLIIGRVP